MSVVFAIPSKKPSIEAQACIDEWRAKGYLTAIWRDTGDDPVDCDLLVTGEYMGYAATVNTLCREAIARFPDAGWIVTGGDDTDPDPGHDADQIARQCTAHFRGTFGVMQPTGDRWGEDPSQPNYTLRGAYIDRVAGSPWLGVEWCRRMYGGDGPLWSGYWHMYVDEELQEVATRLGVFWQRPDLIHLHRHWARDSRGGPERMPVYIRRANAEFSEAKRIFAQRKQAGFPGCGPRCW